MRNKIPVFLAALSLAHAVPVNVTKVDNIGNAITADLNFATGRILTIANGGSLIQQNGAIISGDTATNLTLSGGSMGATLMLGQGLTGNIFLSPNPGGALLISQPGSVGTGTTAPATEWQVISTSAGSDRGIMSGQFSSDTLPANFISRKARGTFSVPVAVVANDSIGSWIGEAYDGSILLQMAEIRFTATATQGTNRSPMIIEFYTGTDAAPSVKTLAMTIDTTQALVGNSAGLTLKSGATFNNITLNPQNGGVIVSDATITNANTQLMVGIQSTTNPQSIINSTAAASNGLLLTTQAANTPVGISPNGVGETRIFFQGTQMITVNANSSTGIRFNRYTTAGTIRTDSGGNLSSAVFGQLPGTATNDNASSGNVGEYVAATVATPGTSLTTDTTSNVTSISLTAGDWDVTGVADYLANAATVITALRQGGSATSATLGSQDSFSVSDLSTTVTADPAITSPTIRFSLASTTTIFLVARATFSVNTLSSYGTIRARRVR